MPEFLAISVGYRLARRSLCRAHGEVPRKPMETSMNRLTATLLSSAIIGGIAVAAHAQARPPLSPPGFSSNFDPAQLPETKGKVAQYTLTPRGDVDGLILEDGTEVQVSPRLSSALVYTVRPGDSVSIRGLRAKATPMVDAVTVTNDASGAVVGGTQPFGRQDVTGKVKATLHTPRGDIGGALLEDGTVVRLPPPEAQRLASLLAPGQTLVVRGFGVVNPLGHVVVAREIGASADKLTPIAGPRMHGWQGHDQHGPRGPRPGGAPGEAPAPGTMPPHH